MARKAKKPAGYADGGLVDEKRTTTSRAETNRFRSAAEKKVDDLYGERLGPVQDKLETHSDRKPMMKKRTLGERREDSIEEAERRALE